MHLDDQFSDINVDLTRQLKTKPQNSHIIIQNGNFIQQQQLSHKDIDQLSCINDDNSRRPRGTGEDEFEGESYQSSRQGESSQTIDSDMIAYLNQAMQNNERPLNKLTMPAEAQQDRSPPSQKVPQLNFNELADEEADPACDQAVDYGHESDEQEEV